MAREIDFVIVCSEVFCREPFADLMHETGVTFMRVSTREVGVVVLDVWGACVRHCLGSEIDAVTKAFKAAAFLNPEVSTLTIIADDGSVSEVHRATGWELFK